MCRAVLTCPRGGRLHARLLPGPHRGVQITAATSSRRADSGTAPSLDARDRAFHVLDEILGEVRDAGRHAFRKSNEVARFGSEYERKKNARRRRQKQNVE